MVNKKKKYHLIYKLLHKNTMFNWTQESAICFKNSKNLIVNNNIIGLYDLGKPIVVTCVANPYGVGAILSHIVEVIENPVFFASSTLGPSERNYSEIHREALAAIFAVQKFHKYIYGHRLILCSDNEALKEIFNPNMDTSNITASRLQRWAVMLSIYDYEFKYRRSKENCPADAMSRLSLDTLTGLDIIKNLSEAVDLPSQTATLTAVLTTTSTKINGYLVIPNVDK